MKERTEVLNTVEPKDKGKGKTLLFLIDGSGSFAHGPMKDAVKAAGRVVAETARSKDKSAYAEIGLWGDKPSEMQYQGALASSSMHPVVIRKACEWLAESGGLNSGSDFAPAAELAKTMAKNGDAANDTHLVIVTDGDLFDVKDAETAFSRLLDENPGMTISAVIAAPWQRTPFHDFIDSLSRYGDRVEAIPCAPDSVGDAVTVAAVKNPADGIRAAIGDLRQEFANAFARLDRLEAALTGRADMQTAKRQSPVEKPQTRTWSR